MPTPKKGRRLGGSSSHQRSMMANLAASLFAAEAIETTEAKAKSLRPYAEKLITKAKKQVLGRTACTVIANLLHVLMETRRWPKNSLMRSGHDTKIGQVATPAF